MKRFFTILLIATSTCLISCTGLLPTSNNVRSFIPGIYARSVNNEFSSGRDTLIISEISRVGNNYRIVHLLTAQRILNGKKLRPKRKQEIWNAVYNEQEKTLHETVKGKLISFNPEGRTLFVGTSEYRKISD